MVAFKLIRRMRYGGWHRHHHGWQRGGRGGWGGRGYGGPGRFFWIARELDLDRSQKKVVFDAIADVKKAAGDARTQGIGALDEIADAVAGEEFDHAAVDKIANDQSAALDKVKIEIVAALEKLHNVLTPEQRGRLRELLARG
jgi:Spy/CpxP family protein refolding chaperone